MNFCVRLLQVALPQEEASIAPVDLSGIGIVGHGRFECLPRSRNVSGLFVASPSAIQFSAERGSMLTAWRNASMAPWGSALSKSSIRFRPKLVPIVAFPGSSSTARVLPCGVFEPKSRAATQSRELASIIRRATTKASARVVQRHTGFASPNLMVASRADIDEGT